MNETTLSVRLESPRTELLDELREIVQSVHGTTLARPESREPADLLIHDLDRDIQGDLARIGELKQKGAVREVFLTSASTSPDVLIQALRMGAREFFPQPLRREDVREAVRNALQAKIQAEAGAGRRKLGKIVVVMGSKGGVGATTVAVNVAARLSEPGGERKVALIDMNLLFGDIPLFLDIDPAFNWGEVVANISRLDATFLMGVLSRHRSGMHFLPSPTRLDVDQGASPEIIERLLTVMQTQFDYIVIDIGQSLDSLSLKILEMCDCLLLISILSLPCLTNLQRLLDTFDSLGYPAADRIRIVVNRQQKNSVISKADVEQSLKRRVSWVIPNDYQTTMSAINQGRLLVEVSRKADITRNIGELAASVEQALAGPNGRPPGGARKP